MNRLVAAGALAVLIAPLACAGVKTDYDHSANFEQYKTFAWKTAPPKPSDGLVNNSLVYARIERAVDQQLEKKGLREDTKKPDVYLTYRFNARNRRSWDDYPAYGWGWGPWGWRAAWWDGDDFYANRYLQGKLVIDMVDAHTHRLIWRAYGTDNGWYLPDVESSKNIDKMAAKAFKDFPPDHAAA